MKVALLEDFFGESENTYEELAKLLEMEGYDITAPNARNLIEQAVEDIENHRAQGEEDYTVQDWYLEMLSNAPEYLEEISDHVEPYPLDEASNDEIEQRYQDLISKDDRYEKNGRPTDGPKKTYTIEFLDVDEELVDTASYKNLSIIKKKIAERLDDPQGLDDLGITSIQVKTEDGDVVFLAMQDEPQFNEDGDILDYGWGILQDDIDVQEDIIYGDSIYNGVYSDLLASSEESETKGRKITGKEKRYNPDQLGIDMRNYDENNIKVTTDDPSFAIKVADAWGLDYDLKKDGIVIIIPEE